MLDIRLLREKPDFVRERLATRGGGDEAKVDEILKEDAERRRKERVDPERPLSRRRGQPHLLARSQDPDLHRQAIAAATKK